MFSSNYTEKNRQIDSATDPDETLVSENTEDTSITINGDSAISDLTDSNIQELSPEELRDRLQKSLEAIKEKDKNLQLAAQFGQQLIESNNFLSAEYEELSNRVKRLTPALLAISSIASSSESIHVSENLLNVDPTDLSWVRGNSLLPHSIRSKNEDVTTITLYEKQSMYDKITTLERENDELRTHFELTLEKFQETEISNHKKIESLRQSNMSLADQLRSTLSDLRDTEQEHFRAVSMLERDLEALRSELTSTIETAQELEADRRRLLRERKDKAKENKNTEVADQEEIRKLSEKIRKLEIENIRLMNGKRDAERKREETQMEADMVADRLHQLERANHENQTLAKVVEDQRKLIEGMREQMEETVHLYDAAINELAFRGLPIPTRNTNYRVVKTIAPNPGEMELVVRNQQAMDPETGEWHLGKWVERSGQRVWQFDLPGLVKEIDDLRQHRVEAFERVRKTVDDLLTSVVDRLPPGLIKGITTKILEPIRSVEHKPEHSPSTDNRLLLTAPNTH